MASRTSLLLTVRIDSPRGACDRAAVKGSNVKGCGQKGCTYCEARDFVDTMKRTGSIVTSATLTYEPDTVGEVIDDVSRPGGVRIQGGFDS